MSAGGRAAALQSAVPSEVTAFVRRLLVAIRDRDRPAIAACYNMERRQIRDKYYMNRQWPRVEEIMPLVRSNPVLDKIFALLYSQLWFKHALLNTDSPRFSLLVEAYQTYNRFFLMLKDTSVSHMLVLPASWVFDILNEFVYFAQIFQERLCEALAKQAEGGPAVDERALRSDAWSVPRVMKTLRDCVESTGVRQLLEEGKSRGPDTDRSDLTETAGFFSLALLSRLHTKVGDFEAAVKTAESVRLSNDAVFARVPRCNLTFFHSLGYSLMMMRRYHDAARCFNHVLLSFNRSLELLARRPNVAPWMESCRDKMLGLLAICLTLSPGCPVEDQVRRAVEKKFQSSIDTISRGAEPAEEELSELWSQSAPSVLALALPQRGAGERPFDLTELSDAQKRIFMSDARARANTVPLLRSYLRLYSSISIDKLAGLARISEGEVRAVLAAIKAMSWQRVGPEDTPAAEGSFQATDPLHFFVVGDMVEVEEAKEAADAAQYLLQQAMSLHKLADAQKGSRRQAGAAAAAAAGGR